MFDSTVERKKCVGMFKLLSSCNSVSTLLIWKHLYDCSAKATSLLINSFLNDFLIFKQKNQKQIKKIFTSFSADTEHQKVRQ